MNTTSSWKFLGFILFTLILIVSFIGGMLLVLGIIFLPLSLLLGFLILKYLDHSSKAKTKDNLIIISYFSFTNLLAFLIGLWIPFMEETMPQLIAIVLLPLLIILTYTILDRFYKIIENTRSEEQNDLIKQEVNLAKEKPIIEFEEKTYFFSVRSLLIFAIGSPLLSFLIYLFFDSEINYWLHEIVVKQTSFFLNLIFNMGSEVVYAPIGKYHWYFDIPGRGSIYFETFCTGIQAIAVFAGIIICTPHSQDIDTSKDILWRKTKSLVISSIIFYVVNIIRMLIQLYLYYIGYAWADIHYSISAASSFIAAIIILLLHKWIPEFIISIIYIGTLITEPIKKKKREVLVKQAKQEGKVSLEQVRKAFGFNKNTFPKEFPLKAAKYDLKIEKNHILVPKNKVSSFVDAVEKKFKTSDDKEIRY